MKYEEMSDFEIEVEVTKALYPFVLKGGYNYSGNRNGFVYCKGGKREQKQRGLPLVRTIKYYCNNPSDAWPIIVDNEISIWAVSESDYEIGMSYSTGEWKAYCVDSVDGESCVSDDGFEASDQNPLRAAMICFLKMKESQS